MKTEPIYQAQRGVTHTCLCILSCCIIGAVHSFVEFIHTTTNLNDIIVICIYLTVHYFGNVHNRILAHTWAVDYMRLQESVVAIKR